MAGMLDQLLEQMSGQVESLQGLFETSDANRAKVDENLGRLVDAVGALTARLSTDAGQPDLTPSLERVAKGQERLVDELSRRDDAEGLDAESRMRLRSIDVQMLRVLEELSAGRQETMAELRMDIAGLTRAITHAAGTRSSSLASIRPTEMKTYTREG